MKNLFAIPAAFERFQGAAAVITMAVICVSMMGCSSPTDSLGKPLSVKGKITLDGQPAADVEVTFSRIDKGAPAKLRTFTVKTTGTGEFTMEKVFPAKYTVMIYDRKAAPADAGGPAVATDSGPYAKYGVESTLVADVKEGQAEHKFDLVSK